MNLVDLMNLKGLESTWANWRELNYVGGSASPFIDEGDGFTSERERVCMLLSLVAHAGGYKTMVGAHERIKMPKRGDELG